jgi:threonine/homoserine/homoserine lactone efflux protein
MDATLFLKGLLIGFSIAAPVGPIGVLCIRRTLADGRSSGLISGLGAATADAVYGSIAGFGLTLISSFLISQQGWIKLMGGLFLCYLGVKTFLSKPDQHAAKTSGEGLPGAYFSTFLLTLTNPMTILSFAAIFAGLGLGAGAGNFASAGFMIVGVFLGSAAWWLALSTIVSMFRQRFNQRALVWVNRLSGVIILFFGVFALSGIVGQLISGV